MKYYIYILLLLFSCSEKAAINTAEADGSTSLPVTYEIFIQSFADSNGDGIGDFPGATSKLDYLKELGVEAVWLMPIMPSPSYHKYDVTDYYNIHPDYGTLDDFKHFVKEAHQRNIKVYIDLVINHSSNQHPWFQSASTDVNSPFRDYYVWADRDSIAEEISKSEISFDSDNINQWHAPNGDTTGLYYYGFFNDGMPDLNFDSPKLKEEVIKISSFWLTDIEVDGFRLDAARHIYPDQRWEDNITYWKSFLNEIQAINPNVFTVGEVWENAERVSNYTPGFTSLFNFDLAFSVLESIKKEENSAATISGHGWRIMPDTSFIDVLAKNRSLFKAKNDQFNDAIFLSNHDQNRYLNVIENNETKAKLAVSILMTLPGQPFIYYGEEIGMKGTKPDPLIREPFLWDVPAKDQMRTTWEVPQFSTDSTVTPAALQLEDPNSIYASYKKWISIRTSVPSLRIGDMIPFETGDRQLIGFYRVLPSDTLLVIHNLSGVEKTMSLNTSELLFSNGNTTQFSEKKLIISGYGSAILK